MKRVLFLLLAIGSGLMLSISSYADETVTVTATSSDISENLDLKTVATLFGQAKDLEQFEQLLNNPDSAFSNLDLNGDGEVDYLRVIETADSNRHLVVIQAVLAQDIYQDVASIFVEKDEATQSVTIQLIGDEYIYGTNYIIEPVYIHRPLIYDWFWGTSWVCWHSPYYWGYYPHWWRPYYCVDPFIYWDHCYWHHYHYPICSYRTGHHHHPHYRTMHQHVRRNDYATRHPERSFATRNASRNITNARTLDQNRRTTMRAAEASAQRTRVTQSTATRQSTATGRQASSMNRTYGSSNVRTTKTSRPSATTTRSSATTPTRTTTTTTTTRTTRTNTSATTPSRSTTTTVRTTTTSPSRSSTPSVTRSTSTSTRSSGTSSTMRSSSTSTVRSSSVGSSVRSSGSGSMRSGGSSTMRSGSSGGSRTR